MRLMDTTGAAVSAPTTGATWFLHDTRRAPLRVYHFELVSGTATFVLEGRPADDHVWTSVATASADAGALVEVWPQMRLRLSAASTAVVICDLDADGRQAGGFSAGRTDA